jgi:hypothetical protein
VEIEHEVVSKAVVQRPQHADAVAHSSCCDLRFSDRSLLVWRHALDRTVAIGEAVA